MPEDLFFTWLYFQKWTGRLPPQIEMFITDIDLGLGLIPYLFTDKKLEEKRHRIQCRDVTARTIIALASGVEKCWWWNLVEDNNNPLGIYHPVYGKLRLMEKSDWSKRPAYYAYQIMADNLNGIDSIEQISMSNEDIYLFECTKIDESTTYVLWEKRDLFYGEEQPSTAFELSCPFKAARITDVFGNEEVKSVNEDVIAIQILDTPVFIEEMNLSKNQLGKYR